MDIDVKIANLCQRLSDCTGFYKDSLPLCAAENVISEFCKIPLSGDFQERYIMGSTHNYEITGNFVGSQFLLPFYSMINEECKTLFGARYADARTLSGMNCLTTLLMSLTGLNDKIAILPAAWGGHPSVQPVCERLGLQVFELPYDRSKWDINYDRANQLLEDEKIQFILLAPSDIIHPFAVEQFDLCNRILLYDVSQTMGLMAGGVIFCPIGLKNTVLFGGTHKTLPGPASGLIMTNNDYIFHKMDSEINPKYLRNTQMHQVISLLFSLMEMECYGKEYARRIVDTSNELGYYIEKTGFDLGKISGQYSETHQLFLFCEAEAADKISKNAIKNGVTLNRKEKALFANTGIRLGTQEIARYNWPVETMSMISDVIYELGKEEPDEARIHQIKSSLPPKTIQYTFSEDVVHRLINALHQK